MNNTKATKTTKVTKKARIGIAALAAIMTMSFAAPLAANAATLPEGQSVVCMALNDTDKETLNTLKGIGLDTMFGAFEEYVPGGKIASPALKSILGSAFGDKEMTLEDIDKKLDGLYAKLDQMEDNLKKEIENVIPTYLFDYTILTPFNSQIRGILDAIRTIRNNDKLTEDEKLCEIGAQIKSDLFWTDQNSAFVLFDSLTTKFNNANILNQKDLFTLIYDYFVSQSMFSGEAIDKARTICDTLMQEYLTGYLVLTDCLLAQNQVVCMSESRQKELNPYYFSNISTNLSQIKNKLDKLSKVVIGNSKRDIQNVYVGQHWDNSALNYNPYNGQWWYGAWVSDYETRDMGKYDKETVSGKYYTMIDQSRQIFVNKGNSCKDFSTKMKTSNIGNYKNYASDSYGARDHFNYRFDGTYLTSDEAKALADYAKAKKMTIREFLTANGFDMKDVAKDAVLITSEVKIDESVSSAVKEYFSGVFTGKCQYSATYTGFNIDSKNPSEKTYSVWTSGVNNWVKWEEKCGSGTAVSFWNRGDSIKGE